jgi:hypothetical protein
MVNGAVVGGRTIPIAIEILGASSVIMNGGTVLSDDDDFGATVTRNSSMFTLNGGSAARVESHDSGKVQINGGRIFTDSWGILMHGASEAVISGGEIIGENATLVLDAAAMRITGGTLRGETFVDLEGDGTVVIEGGRFEARGYGISMSGGMMTILGGEFVAASTVGDPQPRIFVGGGVLHIFGGDFSKYNEWIEGPGTVHLYGVGLTLANNEVMGRLSDGHDVHFTLRDSPNVFVHEVPEPMTVTLVAIGMLLYCLARCRRPGRHR